MLKYKQHIIQSELGAQATSILLVAALHEKLDDRLDTNQRVGNEEDHEGESDASEEIVWVEEEPPVLMSSGSSGSSRCDWRVEHLFEEPKSVHDCKKLEDG